MTIEGPLAGITVLDLSTVGPATRCSRLLADYGAQVVKVGQKTCVPRGCYSNVLVTDEFNPDEPGKHQLKYYARGIGNVRVGWSGKNEETKETLVLIAINRLGPKAMAEARAAARKLEASAYERRKA